MNSVLTLLRHTLDIAAHPTVIYYFLRPTLADWKDAIEHHMTGEGLTRGTNSVPRDLEINFWDLTSETKYFARPTRFCETRSICIFVKNID